MRRSSPAGASIAADGDVSASNSMHIALLSVIILLFASWVTVHVRLCVVLMRQSLVRGLVGLVVFPLAPYWAHQAGVPRLPMVWGILVALYLLALTAGFI